MKALEGAEVSVRGSVMFSNTAHGSARLEIRPGVLQLRLGPLTAVVLGALLGMDRVLVHRHRHVEVFCAVLGPPPFWGNTGVVLRPGPLERSAVVVVNAWRRKHVLDGLREAGFEVIQRPTLMSVGYGAIRHRRR